MLVDWEKFALFNNILITDKHTKFLTIIIIFKLDNINWTIIDWSMYINQSMYINWSILIGQY